MRLLDELRTRGGGGIDRDRVRIGGEGGDDRPPGLAAGPARHDPDTGIALQGPADRSPEPHPVAERFGQTQGQQLGAAIEAVLLGATLGVDQLVEAARRGDIEEDVEHRQLLRPGPPHRATGQADQLAGDLGMDVALAPLGEGLAVELRGTLGAPGGIGAHRTRQAIEATAGDEDVPEDTRAEAGDGAAVAAALATDIEQVPPGAVLGEDLDSQLAGEPLDPDVVRADPLPTEVDPHPVSQSRVEQPATDPIARLKDHDLAAGVGESPRRPQAGEAAPDHSDIGAESLLLSHGPSPLAPTCR